MPELVLRTLRAEGEQAAAAVQPPGPPLHDHEPLVCLQTASVQGTKASRIPHRSPQSEAREEVTPRMFARKGQPGIRTELRIRPDCPTASTRAPSRKP
jgi:hypothetical protein